MQRVDHVATGNKFPLYRMPELPGICMGRRMRLWSLHPKYLDTKGLTACWREGLLARKVLSQCTRGYRNHPQLARFRAQPDPVAAIDSYLAAICAEARQRGYNFDRSKIGGAKNCPPMTVTEGQLAYEREHLLRKLAARDPVRYARLSEIPHAAPHPFFRCIAGPTEIWEKQ